MTFAEQNARQPMSFSDPSHPNSVIKIISWNVLHRAGTNLEEIERLIQNERPDPLLMQEATSEIDFLPARVGGNFARVDLSGQRRGLAVWSLRPFLKAPESLKLQLGALIRRVC